MYKNCNVVMLPTNKKAQLVLGQQLANVGETDIPNDKDITKQHLYIISDDEIKKDDWCIINNSVGSKFIVQFNNGKYYHRFVNNGKGYNTKEEVENRVKKIIVTTDISLWKHDDTVPYPKTKPALPQPSQAFIEKYVEEYNKDNIITDVLVEYVKINTDYRTVNYPKPQAKVNFKDNTITIKKV